MRRWGLLVAVGTLLLGCTATPTPSPSVEVVSTYPPTTKVPTAVALATGILPATWTPPSAATAEPTWTRTVMATAEAPEAPAKGDWPPGAIPSITLTPTPADAVSEAARRAYSRAQAALEAGNLAQALTRVDEALALAPEHTDFLALRGQILLAQQHPLQGESDLRTALSYDPFNAAARRALADLYARYDRWRDAESEYKRYVTLAPADLAGWFALGTAREAQGQILPAIQAYSETLMLDPAHLDSLRHRGDLWLAQENYRAAWSDYTSLVALSPSADLYRTRAEINLQLGSPLLAAVDFQSAISLTLSTGSPDQTLMIDLGRAYLAGGAAEQAAAVFSVTLELTDTLEVRILLGESYLATGVYTEALRVFSETLPLAVPAEKAPVLIGQARAFMAAGNYRQAEETLGSALDFAISIEQRAEILGWRSQAYLGMGAHERALADLEAAEELVPSPLHLYGRSAIREAAGQVQRAIDDLVAFLEAADPETVDAAVIADAEARLAALTGAP
jgi:tetratricopeptide (TPR) repeat protein